MLRQQLSGCLQTSLVAPRPLVQGPSLKIASIRVLVAHWTRPALREFMGRIETRFTDWPNRWSIGVLGLSAFSKSQEHDPIANNKTVLGLSATLSAPMMPSSNFT